MATKKPKAKRAAEVALDPSSRTSFDYEHYPVQSELYVRSLEQLIVGASDSKSRQRHTEVVLSLVGRVFSGNSDLAYNERLAIASALCAFAVGAPSRSRGRPSTVNRLAIAVEFEFLTLNGKFNQEEAREILAKRFRCSEGSIRNAVSKTDLRRMIANNS